MIFVDSLSIVFLSFFFLFWQGEMQQLRDKLAIAERAARSEAQLKVWFLLFMFVHGYLFSHRNFYPSGLFLHCDLCIKISRRSSSYDLRYLRKD